MRAELLREIRETGFAVRTVRATAHPSYATTLGLTAHAHPELVCVDPSAGGWLAEVAGRVLHGRRLLPGRRLAGVGGDRSLAVGVVDRGWLPELFTQALNLYGDRVEVLQLGVPDPDLSLPPGSHDGGWGIYPWPFPSADLDASAWVSRRVFDGAPPGEVEHEADGTWVVGPRGDAVRHPLDDLLARHPSLRAVADLPRGVSARL